MTDAELLQALEFLRDTMISVATGGPRINEVNEQFQQTYALVAAALARRGIHNPLPFGSLWEWYGRWRSGDLPTYQSRREFVAGIFNPLFNRIRTGRTEDFEPTGWARVDRCVDELRDRLASATNEEQFQAVGLFCREALISVAQAVYDVQRHPSLDGVAPSQNDAKRMLEAYISAELRGGVHEDDSAACIRDTAELINHLWGHSTPGGRLYPPTEAQEPASRRRPARGSSFRPR